MPTHQTSDTECAGLELVNCDTNAPLAPFLRSVWEVEEKPGLGCMKLETSQWKLIPIIKNVKP